MFTISIPPEDIERGLESWSWLPLEGKSPFLVTAFGDVFFEDPDGIWFLDTIGGTLEKVADSRNELESILKSEEGENHFYMAGFVERANREGMTLSSGECYDFKLNPVLGGPIEYDNVVKSSFVVSVHISGQIHQQVKDLPEGTKITGFTVKED
jgi:hypothetical protein